MKIALIGTTYPYRGGLAAYNERLMTELQNQGHETTIYTFTLQYPNFLFPGKSQYSDEPRPKHLKIVECVNSVNPINWWQVGKRIRKEGFDLVLVKYWLPFMGPCFGTILQQIKKGANNKTKVVTIIDNIIPHEKRIGDTVFTKYYVKYVDAFIAMSKEVLRQIYIFDSTKPRLFSPHPIFDNFGDIGGQAAAKAHLNLDPNYQYVLFFGLIRDYKGLDLLLNAFAEQRFRNSNIRLVIAGEYYADKEKYQQIIQQHQLQDELVQVDQFITDSDVAYYFNACDLVAQPYKTATQSGVTQIAYHFNKPMIVTNVGGLPEMCPDGKVGYVVPPNPKDIANAIWKFFNDTDQAAMIENIIEEKKKYSWQILTNNIFKLAKSL